MADGSQELFGKFVIRKSSAQNLKGVFISVFPSETVFAKFVIRKSSIGSLKGHFISVFPSKAVFAKFTLVCRQCGEFKAEFIVRNPWSRLFATFTSRKSASETLYGKSFIIHSSSNELKAILTVRNRATLDLFAEFYPINNASSELKASFIPQRGLWWDIKAYFRIRRPSYEILVPDTYPWINFVAGLGRAFIEKPAITSDSLGGIKGARLESVVSAHRHEGIRFGWVAEKVWSFDERIYQSLKELKGSFYVMVNIISPPNWKDLTFPGAWWHATPGVFDQIYPTEDYIEVVVFNPRNVIESLAGAFNYMGTMKKYEGGTIVFDLQFSDPHPSNGGSGSSPAAGFSSHSFLDASDDCALIHWDTYYNRWSLRVAKTDSGENEEDLSGLGINFEERHVYKIIWETPAQFPPNGRVRLYIDDGLKKTITTHIPSLPQSFAYGGYGGYMKALGRCGAKLYELSDA